MNILGVHFHNWKKILVHIEATFMGEKYIDESQTGYRICSQCEKIQKYEFDHQGGWWETLNHSENEIMLSKIKEINGKFFLPDKNLIRY